MRSIPLEQLQTQLDALIIAGAVTSPIAEVLAVWNQVRQHQPDAWREMCDSVFADPEHDLVRALCRQCNVFWGCALPLHEALADQVGALLDTLVERGL